MIAAFESDRETRVGERIDALDLEPRERGLAREIALGVVRRLRLLDHLLGGLATRGLPEDADTLAALRVGAYQLLFLDRVPLHTAVGQSVSLAPRGSAGFVNAVLRRLADAVRRGVEGVGVEGEHRDAFEPVAGRRLIATAALPDASEEPAARAALLAGLPDELVAGWFERYGAERAQALCEASNQTPSIHLRAVGVERDALAAELAEAGVTTEPGVHPRTLRWTGGASPFRGEAFESGRFVVQDPTAVEAAEALEARAGERILDLCAAPGTKATLLAEQVGPEGMVWAHDVVPARLRLIAENAERLGLDQLRVVPDLARIQPADRTLVDVPCSNTGVLARRPEARHRLGAESFASLEDLQRRLLVEGLRRTKSGGLVVYSTCSIEDSENAGLVAAVLAAEPGLAEFVDEVEVLPDPPHRDGGYRARLRRR